MMTKTSWVTLAVALFAALVSLVSAQVLRSSILDTSADIPFFIEDGSRVPGYASSDRELARMAFDAWSRESGRKLRFAETSNSELALIRVNWVSANQGLFGETRRIRLGDKTGAEIFVIPQIADLIPALARRSADDRLLRDTVVYLTCVHELGHAIGLEHTDQFNDIMYFFGFGGDIEEYFLRYRRKLETRPDIAKYSGLSTGDVRVLTSLYR